LNDDFLVGCQFVPLNVFGLIVTATNKRISMVSINLRLNTRVMFRNRKVLRNLYSIIYKHGIIQK